MKYALIMIIFFLFITRGYSQQTAKYRIDTLHLRYTIPGIVDLLSVLPQLKGDIPKQVKENINKDIRQHFSADIRDDSAHYVQKLLAEYDVSTLDEYHYLIAESGPDEYSEDYRFPYVSDDLLCFTYASALYPAGGRPQFTFESNTYDLKTGESITFNELLSIGPGQFKEVLLKKGYFLEELSIPDTPFVKVPVAAGMDDPDAFIKSLYAIDDAGCVAYYLEEQDSAVHLMFHYQCNGPAHFTFGIDLNELRPWLEHSTLRNMYRTWGEDMNSLKGIILSVRTDVIHFDSYTVRNGGGYIIDSGDTANNTRYFISYWNSEDAFYYVLERAVSKAENEKRLVLDVLEIKKAAIAGGHTMVENCETSAGPDAEIIALVKKEKNNPSYYKKIVQAWRANRAVGRFEPVERKKVKSCPNESDGI